jgi:hypothetical protein
MCQVDDDVESIGSVHEKFKSKNVMISYLIPCGDAGLKERVPSEVNEKK